MKLVTILIPCFNEAQSLPLLYQSLNNVADAITDYEFEYLFINDGSKDLSLDILRTLHKQDERVCYVDLSRNFGKENAMLAGFDYAKGDAVIIMDADLQHPPTLIPEMLTECLVWSVPFIYSD